MLKSSTKKTAKLKRLKSSKVLLLAVIPGPKLSNFYLAGLSETSRGTACNKNANSSGRWPRSQIITQWNQAKNLIDLKCIYPQWNHISKNTSHKWMSLNSQTFLSVSTTPMSRGDLISSTLWRLDCASSSKRSNATSMTALWSCTSAQRIRLARRF